MIQDAPGRNAAKNSVLTKHKFPAKSFFFYLSVKMNRMAKIWCTVPRMIFVGGFAQPAVHSMGATAKKHCTRICQNQSFEEKTANSCRNGARSQNGIKPT